VSYLDGAQPAPPAAATRALVDGRAGDHGGGRLVLVNGVHVPALSDPVTSAGVVWGAAGAVGGPDATEDPARYDGFQALNGLATTDTAVVLVEDEVRIDAPIHLVHVTAPVSGPALAQPRTRIHLGRGSALTVIESYVGLRGDDSSAVTNATTTITLEPGATLVHQRVQDAAPTAVHVGHTRVRLGAGSHLRSTSVHLGADIGRHALDVTLAEPGARADLAGLYLPTAGERHDTVVTVDHAASGGTSTQRFKGVIGDDGRGSFSGHVIVRPGTTATDARQSNRNLLLGRTAQADTRPWLEIFADDVRCSHGATVGRLDDDALFYLRSRGIALDEARALLVAAFADEITSLIEPASLRAQVQAAVAARIGGGA
jgi:Fe-S cluster assembly protein SufD